VIEDGRPVLFTDVAELSILDGRVYIVPEDVEQLAVGDFRGIVDDLNGLRVARRP